MFDLIESKAEVHLFGYNSRTNEVHCYDKDPNDWIAIDMDPDSMQAQVFIWVGKGLMVTDELGSVGWFDADATLETVEQSVILWAAAVGLKVAAQE